MVAGWVGVGPLAVGFALVGREWATVTAVVMEFRNVTKITDRHTVQTEGQLKYSLCQVPISVNVSVSSTFSVTY